MRLLFRLTGYILLISAAILFGYDTVAALEQVGFQLDSYAYTDLGSLWFHSHPDSLQTTQSIIQRYLLPFLWDPIIQWLLLQPAYAVAGIVSIVLILLSLPKKKPEHPHYSIGPIS